MSQFWPTLGGSLKMSCWERFSRPGRTDIREDASALCCSRFPNRQLFFVVVVVDYTAREANFKPGMRKAK